MCWLIIFRKQVLSGVLVDCLQTTGVVICIGLLSSDNRCCQVCWLIVFRQHVLSGVLVDFLQTAGVVRCVG